MGIYSTKSWFAVDRSGKLVFFTDYINIKKGNSVVFFILLSKTEFKELLPLATKDSHFIFDGTLYKQIDGVAMGSPYALH